MLGNNIFALKASVDCYTESEYEGFKYIHYHDNIFVAIHR